MYFICFLAFFVFNIVELLLIFYQNDLLINLILLLYSLDIVKLD